MRRIPVALATLACLLVTAQRASDARAEPPPKDWDVELLGYGWIPSLDAKVEIDGVGARHVDTSLRDTINALDLGAMGRVSGRYRRFVGLVDGMWAKLEDDDHVGGAGFLGQTSVDANVETQSAFVQALGGYRVYQRQGGLFGDSSRDKTFGVDLLTGVTYTWIKENVRVDFERDALLRSDKETRHFGGSKDWIGPFVGGRLTNDFTPRLRLETYGGASGFGVGSSPDVSWQLTTLLSYRITDRLLLTAGHRLIDYEKGDLDVRIHGPIVGLGYRF